MYTDGFINLDIDPMEYTESPFSYDLSKSYDNSTSQYDNYSDIGF